MEFREKFTIWRRQAAIWLGLGSAGFVTDVIVSSLTLFIFNTSALIAGLTGFAVSAAVRYFVDLFHTFSEHKIGFSFIDLYRYTKSCAAAFAVRSIALSLLGWLTALPNVVIILLAIMASSLTLHLLAHFYVFRIGKKREQLPSLESRIRNGLSEWLPSDTKNP